jgi:hypothetical protein
MSQPGDRATAHGLLDELDDIRSLLEEPGTAARIPVLEDAVDVPEDGVPALAHPVPAADAEVAAHEPAFPLSDPSAEAEFAAFSRPPAWEDIPELPRQHERAVGSLADGGTLTERLVGKGLDAAIRSRIDATLEHWVNETLQVELALLRARLQDAVRTEVEAFISQEIHQSMGVARSDGETHGEPHGE